MSESNRIKTRILQRTDTENNWNLYNPSLSSGEIIFVEKDNEILMKVGNGQSYQDTPFFSNVKLNGNQLSTLNIHTVSRDVYHDLVINEEIDENSIYIISSDTGNMYGNQIKNLGDATEEGDAVNLGQLLIVQNYVDESISAVNSDLSTLESNVLDLESNVSTLAQDLSYKLISASYVEEQDESLGTEVHKYEIANRTITSLNVDNADIPVSITVPVKMDNALARDFILKINITSSSAPSFIFDGVDETISFISDNETWSQLDVGTNIMSFTEVSESEFLVHRKQY